jgi:hypothetical protein
MNSQNKISLLTIVLWTIMLVIYPFFYSGATGTMILTQADLAIAGLTFMMVVIGLRISGKLFTRLNYSWATMTLTWVLVANISRLLTKTKMELFDAVYARAFFSAHEWWIIALLVITGVITMYFLFTNLKTTTVDSGQNQKMALTVISVAVPILWCLTLNLKN